MRLLFNNYNVCTLQQPAVVKQGKGRRKGEVFEFKFDKSHFIKHARRFKLLHAACLEQVPAAQLLFLG